MRVCGTRQSVDPHGYVSRFSDVWGHRVGHAHCETRVEPIHRILGWLRAPLRRGSLFRTRPERPSCRPSSGASRWRTRGLFSGYVRLRPSASLRLRRGHRDLAVLVHRHDVSVGAARSKPDSGTTSSRRRSRGCPCASRPRSPPGTLDSKNASRAFFLPPVGSISPATKLPVDAEEPNSGGVCAT